MRLHFERYFPHYPISRNVASLNLLVYDMINLLYYEHWTDKQKDFYVYRIVGCKLEERMSGESMSQQTPEIA